MPTIPYFLMLAAISIPIIYYVYQGWRNTNILSGSEFFIADRKLSIVEYYSSSVAYGLQMAAIILFAQWGYYYGFWTFIVPAAWGIGFLLLYFAIPRLNSFFDNTFTLHGFIASNFKKNKLIIYAASLATILGLGGALFAELKYVSYAIQIIVDSPNGELLRNILIALFLSACLVYILPGGFRAVVATDSKQLPLSYIGIAALLGTLIYSLVIIRGPSSAFAPLIIGLLVFGLMFIINIRNTLSLKLDIRRSIRIWLVPALSIIIIIFLFATAQQSNGGITENITGEWHPYQMPLITIISLIVANSFWQLVDLSAFQRLSSVELPSDIEQRNIILRKGILWTALESPLSWCLGIAIGISLGKSVGFGGPDGAWSAMNIFLKSLVFGDGISSGIPVIIRYFAFSLGMASFVAIMLSTVDSLGSAISFTTTSDLIFGGTDVKETKVAFSRIVTVITLIIIWGGLVFWEGVAGEDADLAGWLYVAYAMQLSLFGAMIAIILKLDIQPWLVTLSIIAGIVSSAITGALLAIKGDPSVYVTPPLVAVGVSLFIVFGGYLLGKVINKTILNIK